MEEKDKSNTPSSSEIIVIIFSPFYLSETNYVISTSD